MIIFGHKKSVRLRETHENVYGNLSGDSVGEEKKFSGRFRETPLQASSQPYLLHFEQQTKLFHY